MPAADSIPYLGLPLQPDGEFSLQRKHRLRLAAVHHWCLNTLAPRKVVQTSSWRSLGELRNMLPPSSPMIPILRATWTTSRSRSQRTGRGTLSTPRGTACRMNGLWDSHGCQRGASRQRWPSRAHSSICPEVHYPVPAFATLAGGDWFHRIPRALAALWVGALQPHRVPQSSSRPATVPPAKLRHRDTCRLTVPHTTPWHKHHGPHHPFPHNDDPWPAAVRECLNQCADEHVHYCRREQERTDHPGWRDALVHLFHTTSTQDPRLRLVHRTRAKQDAHTGPRVTSDGLHLHVGGYRRPGSLSPPTQGAAYHPPAALLCILRDVLADGEQQEPNADVAWPKPLCPRPHAPTPVLLVTTDDQCARPTEQAQLQAEWVIVQVGAGQSRPRGLPRGTALLVAMEVPHDPHMAVHTLEDQPEDTGHLVVHQRGGPAWLREHVTALRSWASTVAGAEI